MMRRPIQVLAAAILTGAAITGCSTARVFERETTFVTMGVSQEAQLGADFAAELASSMEIINDPSAQQWLDRVGAALVAESPQIGLEFRFFWVNDMAVNAFAIPGGYCYINRGLLEFVDNEAQLVAVIGHEINHVTRRHGVARMQRQMAAALAAQAVASRASSAEGSMIAAGAINISSFLATRQFSQADESEADLLGVKAMHAAGWDPREAAALWQKMGEASGGQPPFWLEAITSTHPNSARRREDILKLCQTLDLTSRQLIKDTPEFQAMRARFQRMPRPAGSP